LKQTQKQQQQQQNTQAPTDATQLTSMDTTTNSTSYKPNKNKPSIHSSSSEEDVRRAAKSKQHANTNATGKNNATGTTHNRFIRRLFACSGYCACSSRHSLSASNSAYGLSKSATNIQANNTATNNKANKTAFSNNTNDNETDNNNNNNNNNNDNINNEIENKNSQPHSDFNEIKMPEEITSKCTSNHGNRKGQQSYESLIDKILSTPTKLRPNNVSHLTGGSSKPISILSSKSISKKSNDNTSSESAPPSKSSPAVKASTFKPRKIILNETLKKLESDNHKLFKKEAITDKVSYQRVPKADFLIDGTRSCFLSSGAHSNILQIILGYILNRLLKRIPNM